MEEKVFGWAHAFFLVCMGSAALTAASYLIWAVWPEHWRGDGAAAWVQAIGSLVAIIAAALLALHQSKAARSLAQQLEREKLRRRWSSVKAVVDALYQQCLDVAGEFEGNDDFHSLSFILNYDEKSFSEAIRRVEDVPLFELDSATLVTAVTGFKDAVERLKKWIDEGRQRSRPNWSGPDEHEPDDWQVKQAGEGCMRTVSRCYVMVHSIAGGTLLTEAQPVWERPEADF
ncbi:hypothetical protein [Ralstonia solanacearum]|uniref:hypothetical protein n=1 Tax=Ralstonia solanacearum TaxID=305 RepID=UPI001300CDE3|nr:hypothetical protein [Ralstonia solanacearum]